MSKATKFWVLRNSGDFVTGRLVVGLLLGVTKGKGTAVTAARCFLCNAEAYGSHAIFWYAGSLPQEVLATGSVQSLGAFAKLRTATGGFMP